MPLTLSERTEQVVAHVLAGSGHASADDLVREAVLAFAIAPGLEGPPTDEELDAAFDEADRIGGNPVDQVRAELAAQFGSGALAADIAVGIAQADRGEMAAWDPSEVRREVARRVGARRPAGT